MKQLDGDLDAIDFIESEMEFRESFNIRSRGLVMLAEGCYRKVPQVPEY